MITFARTHLLLLAGAMFAALPGCSAGGRVGGLLAFEDAAVVTDTLGRESAVISAGRVTTVAGRPVGIVRSGPWVVLEVSKPAYRLMRTSSMNLNRLLKRTTDRELTAVNVSAGESFTVPNALDSDDEQIVQLRVQGERLYAVVRPRFIIEPPTNTYRYFVSRLPDGPWEPVAEDRGRRMVPPRWTPPAYADLRAAATQPSSPARTDQQDGESAVATASFEDAQRRGLSSGAWGQVVERKQGNRWQAFHVAPDGRETALFRR